MVYKNYISTTYRVFVVVEKYNIQKYFLETDFNNAIWAHIVIQVRSFLKWEKLCQLERIIVSGVNFRWTKSVPRNSVIGVLLLHATSSWGLNKFLPFCYQLKKKYHDKFIKKGTHFLAARVPIQNFLLANHPPKVCVTQVYVAFGCWTQMNVGPE